jgi:hypothetical protein
MLNQIEQHFPGFRRHIRMQIVGTPTTIERYLLKNGGAVGGPKNAIGQEMLNRLHARSEWKNLYFCGDSTVMATGAPATVVSGVGAACVILRDLKKKDYDKRQFQKQYIRFVDLPYRRPVFQSTEPISAENAYLAAAQCQGCEEPACVDDCPAGVDIPGFLRRIEAQNYAGAARVLRERNAFSEVCGYTCAANQTCQRRCQRRTFAGEPVRIAGLQRWVCEAAGAEGWLRHDREKKDRAVAVVGAGVAGLSCAYYLALAGCDVDVYEEVARPGDRISRAIDVPEPSLARDVNGIMLARVRFSGKQELSAAHIEIIRRAHDALVMDAGPFGIPELGAIEIQGGSTSRASDLPAVLMDGSSAVRGSIVEAAAEGRRAAVAIAQALRTRGDRQ